MEATATRRNNQAKINRKHVWQSKRDIEWIAEEQRRQKTEAHAFLVQHFDSSMTTQLQRTDEQTP